METYKKIIGYVPKFKWVIAVAVLIATVSSLFTIWAYFNIYRFFQEVIVFNDLSSSAQYAYKIIGILIGGYVLYMVSVFMTHVVAFRLETVLRKKGIDGLTNTGYKFFDVNSSGKTRKIIDDNAAQTHTAVAHLIPDLTGGFITPIAILVLGFVVDIKIGIYLTVLFAVSLFLMKKMSDGIEFLEKYQQSLEKLSEESVEYVRGMQVVKIFGAGVKSFKNFHNAIKSYSKLALEYSMSCKKPYSIFQVLFFGTMAITVPVAVLTGNFGDTPEIAAVNLIMLLFFSGIMFVALMKIMYVGMYVNLATLAINKLEALYDEMEEDSVTYGNKEEFNNYNIEFENVDFSYGDNKVLSDFNLKLNEGKSYALVGGSGSGKSTIAKLISGFYSVDSGKILIGNENIREYSEKALTNNISFVFQDPGLFKKTIYENVLIGNPDASKDEVLSALHLAGCDSILDKFPDRENTLIGSKGIYLSGGEKQRIAIARAILKDAPIVILDEASGAVDPENEYEFQKAFKNLMKGKTVIMIAHRLSSIRNVDEILVLEKGKVIERGKDGVLMEEDSKYRYYQTLYAEANDWRVKNG